MKGCCQSNVPSPVSFAMMLIAVRLKWHRSVMFGRFVSVSEVRSFCLVHL